MDDRRIGFSRLVPLVALAAIALAGCGALSPAAPAVPVCGDGIVQAGEQCDGAIGCAAGEVCLSTCECSNGSAGQPADEGAKEPESPPGDEGLVAGTCGDGVINTGEECDGLREGTIDPICPEVCDANGCKEDCSVGVLGCSADEYCSVSCSCETRTDVCGDGVITSGFEECEPEFCQDDGSGEVCNENWGCAQGVTCDPNTCTCLAAEAEGAAGPSASKGTPAATTVCGNAVCETGETCATCSTDCGLCTTTGGQTQPQATSTPQTGAGACAGAATVETLPVYDCSYSGGGWTYYEGMRCFAADGTQLFDGRVSGPYSASEWQPFCPPEP